MQQPLCALRAALSWSLFQASGAGVTVGECPLLQPGCTSLLPSLGHPPTVPSLLPHTWGVCPFPSHALMQGLLCFWYSWWRGCCSPLQSQSLLQSHPIPTQAVLPCTPLPWQQALYHCSVPCPGCPFLQPLPNNPLVTRTSPVKRNGGRGLTFQALAASQELGPRRHQVLADDEGCSLP